jgi:CBS domain-containing protein
METIKVKTILLPYRKEMPTYYTVMPEDKVIYAVELMVDHNMKTIAVVRNGRPIGMIRLEDALKKLGLDIS